MIRIISAIVAFIGAAFQIFTSKTPPEEAFLFNFIVFIIGFWGISAFIAYCFKPDVGWQPKVLFRKVVAFFNLFRGILGILCIWFSGDFWTITVVVSSIFIFSYGCYEFKHVEEIGSSENKPTYYTDFIVSFDLFFPLALIVLLVVYKIGM